MGSYSDEREGSGVSFGTSSVPFNPSKTLLAPVVQPIASVVNTLQGYATVQRQAASDAAGVRVPITVGPATESLTLPGGFPDIGVVPVVVEAPRPVPPPVLPSPSDASGGLGTVTTTKRQGESMTAITDLIGNLGTQYIQSRFQQPQVIQVDNPFIPNFLEQYVDPSVNAPAAADACYKGRYLIYDTKTGEYRPRRRRRRRAMLTKSDIADLSFISTLPNNANTKTALAMRITKA